MDVTVNDPAKIEQTATCTVKRKPHWSETIVDDVMARVKAEQAEALTPREKHQAEKKESAEARLKRQMFVALRQGYYNRLDADAFEQFGETEHKIAGNGVLN